MGRTKLSWQTFFCWVWQILVTLRYRIEVKGLKELDGKLHQGKGILFLPNHPAEVDPILLTFLLYPHYQPHPLVVENFYYQKGIRFFMDLVGALPLPNMDVANQWKARQIERLRQKIARGLQKGESYLIYPGGGLKLTGEEMIGGASFVHDLIQETADVNVVLVRTTGLWGSSFSRALTGKTPDFSQTLWRGFLILLKNGLFFTPRRKVTIEVEANPSDFPFKVARRDFNRYLEEWYNQYPEKGPEPLSLVSYCFWKKELPQVAALDEKTVRADEVAIAPEIQEEVFAHLAVLTRYPREQIKRDMHLSFDLGLDSLDLAQLGLFVEERFDGSPVLPGELQTVEDLLKAAAGFRKELEGAESKESEKAKWPREKRRPGPEAPKGNTLQEAFLFTSARMGNKTACADAMTKALSYQKLKRAALVLSLKMKELPGEHIGVLLPSSVAAYVTILAILLAKKVPVMLNWTVGKAALEHAVKVADVKVILSSRRFLDRLDNAEFGSTDELFLLLEDVRHELPLLTKLFGLYLSLQKPETLMKKLNLTSLSAEDHAVILFTSGTETLPKGVALTHTNLLSNQSAAFSCVSFEARDILYGILPPFHSFGFSVTGLLPLLFGLKVLYSPDPTDSYRLANEIGKWKPTLFCAAPSFIKALFKVAQKDQLKSLRLIVSGAEKTPDELFEFVKTLGINKKLLEGYGITECSPIVTLDRPNRPHRGVGQPLPGVELCVIDPETQEILPPKAEGEICVNGPNVFKGYLGAVIDPFISLQGKRWYRSGDRGYLTDDMTLVLTGRLKRFVKIGGEMVGLSGLEDDLFELAREKGWVSPLKREDGPPLAITVLGRESDKPQLILFTTFDVTKEQVNTALKEMGLGRIVKISEVKQLPEIPLTGTGKTHYRLLDEMGHGQ